MSKCAQKGAGYVKHIIFNNNKIFKKMSKYLAQKGAGSI